MNSRPEPTKFDVNLFSSQTESMTQILNQFLDALSLETEAIKKNLTQQLLDASSLKSDLANQIEEKTQTLNTILEKSNVTINYLSDSSIFSTLPIEIQNNSLALIELIQKCQDKNLANGMSIQMLSNINQHALDLISGKKKDDTNLYSSSGEKTRSGHQSSLGKA